MELVIILLLKAAYISLGVYVLRKTPPVYIIEIKPASKTKIYLPPQ